MKDDEHMSTVEILIVFSFFIVAVFFLRVFSKMKGNKTDDEMFVFFLGKAFRNVGLVMFVFSGLSLIWSYSRIMVFNDNISIQDARLELIGELKYFIIGLITYLISYFSFIRKMKKSDEEIEEEGEENE